MEQRSNSLFINVGATTNSSLSGTNTNFGTKNQEKSKTNKEEKKE